MTQPNPRPLRTGEKIAFALGDVFGGGGAVLLNVLYFWFLSGVIGLSPALAGAVFAVGKVWDALAKPVVGQVSDNARTRWGRRRPFIIGGGLLLILALGALYFPTAGWPTWSRAAFALASCLFYTTVAAVITTPYASLSTELTTDPQERNFANVLRLACSGIGSAIVTLTATALSSQVQHGRLAVAAATMVIVLGYGGVFTLVVLGAGLASRERVPLPVERARFQIRTYALPPRVPAWRSLLGLYLCAGLTMDVVSTQLIALTLYVIHVNSTIFMGVILLVSFASFPVINHLTKRVGKARIYGTLLPLAVAAAVGVTLYQPTWPGWPAYALAAVLAVGIAGSQQMTWVMFPDVVDAGELQFGARMAGTFGGLMTLIRSLGTAVLIQAIGVVLQLAGYRAATAGRAVPQEPGAIVALRVLVGGMVAGLCLAGWLLSRRYPLTYDRVAANHAALADARGDHRLPDGPTDA